MLVLPLKTQEIPTGSFPRSSNKLPFHHNVTLTVSLSVGSPPQNVTMVLDTGSELSWLHCNSTSTNSTSTRPMFNPNTSSSYSPITCSSPTCMTQTQDFPIPASCDSNQHCHATLSYADASSSEGNLASDIFGIGGSNVPGTIFGCMDSGYSSNSEEDFKTTGLMGNNNFTWLMPLNYTPLVQISIPLPYYDRAAYTVKLQGIKVSNKILPLPKSILEPDHTGAGQTMVDSGTQFSFLLGPAYNALRNEFLNQTSRILRVLDDPNFVFQGAMDLCYLIPVNQTSLPSLPSVGIMFGGAEMSISGEKLLYRVPGETRGKDSVWCFTFGNSELLGIEAYVIGHHHQQNMWMEFDLEKSRIGFAQVKCDLASQRFGLYN
ncbi:hypothetical protein AgCh_035858 [Apium graveolens]